MNPQSFGSFGNVASDDMSAIKDAMARRGIGDQVPALDTQSTAGTNPSPLPAEAQGTPSGGVGGAIPSGASPSPQLTPQGNPEAKLIIGALRERLKALSVIDGGVPPKVPSIPQGGM